MDKTITTSLASPRIVKGEALLIFGLGQPVQRGDSFTVEQIPAVFRTHRGTNRQRCLWRNLQLGRGRELGLHLRCGGE
jgi:hypothetical protein